MFSVGFFFLLMAASTRVEARLGSGQTRGKPWALYSQEAGLDVQAACTATSSEDLGTQVSGSSRRTLSACGWGAGNKLEDGTGWRQASEGGRAAQSLPRAPHFL